MSATAAMSRLLLAAILLFASGMAVSASEGDRLEIRFTDRGIVFSGQVPSEEVGQTIAASARAVRPDLAIVNRGLEVDPAAEMPPLADLGSLLAELGLSTHEGGITFEKEQVILTGMTDSLVTATAVQIRLEPLLEGRTLVNRLCIVSPADMPDLSIRLSSSEATDALLDFDAYPTAEEAFSLPGLAPERIYPSLQLLGDFERFLDPNRRQSGRALRAIPMDVAAAPVVVSPEEAGPPQFRAVPAEPVPTLVALESIRFSRNSFLLQSGGTETLARLAEQLAEDSLAAHPILLRSIQWKGTSPAYVEYLAERRASEAKRHLVSVGVPADRIRTSFEPPSSSFDPGEVRVLVELPPPPAPGEEGASPEDAPPGDDPSETNPASETGPKPEAD